MEQFTQSERKELRRLAGLAYERELRNELAALEGEFAAWRAGRLSPFQLSDAIHEFHNETARRLYVAYTRRDPEVSVPRAVALGVLTVGDIAGRVWEKIQERVGFYEHEARLRSESANPAGSRAL